MMHYFIPYLVVSFIYSAVAIDFWRTARRMPDQGEAVASMKLHSSMIALALILHAGLLYRDIFATDAIHLGLLYALSAILWLTALIYWIANLKHQLHSLQAFVLPLAALFVLLSGINLEYQPPSQEEIGALFIAHVSIAILAYSLFTFAALHALLMAIVERSLHNKPTFVRLPSFPPLILMESLLFKVIVFGFTLLTLTVLSGMLFSEEIFGKPLQFTHKVIFSIASWFIYAWLLYGRFRHGWRGKIAIRWTLFGFILLLLAYVGTHFVIEIVLGR
jgi:ABC-type uncharacterized transport system permease subunit